VTNERFDGEADADRWFGGVTGNADWDHRQWRIGANLGAFYSREKRDGFTETGPTTGSVTQGSQTTRLGQIRLGGRVGYAFERLEPFVKARYEFDFNKSDVNVAANQTRPSDDDHGIGVGAGVDFDIAPNVVVREQPLMS